jgi:hypothetical protein
LNDLLWTLFIVLAIRPLRNTTELEGIGTGSGVYVAGGFGPEVGTSAASATDLLYG